jgi:FlaA1/EpsC-like NDP-sugar epimerase
VDDDPSLWGTVVDGLPVYAPDEIGRMLGETGAKQVLLAIPSAARQRRREILDLLDPYPVHVRTLPGFKSLVDGKVKVQDLQEVDIADLLGREPVEPDAALFVCCIRDQVVMVTGAGGSIGSELCRQIVTCGPRVLILFEHSEFALYSIHTELERFIKERGLPIKLAGVLGSVRNGGRMFDALTAWKVDTVYHAAAYKHVPIVEHNIAQGFFNNTMGTLHAAQAAICAGVRNFVLVSTDKAVRPTNVMGCTKRLAEMVLQALAVEPAPALYREVERGTVENRTRFTMVRFGNVLGSSGSVIPLFREQIRRGGPITVTDPRITRYFMTIPEAAQLVIQAGAMGEGGDVFVLDMGKPVKIVDLAERIVHLSGLTVRNDKHPDGDIQITFTGLRPGEKLYEELLIGDNVLPTAHPMIMRANEERLSWNELTIGLEAVVQAIKRGDYPAVREVLKLLVSGYTPDEKLVDLIYLQRHEA